MPDFDPYLTWLGVPPLQRPPTYYQLLGVDPAITDVPVIKALALQRIAYVRNFQRSEHAQQCTNLLEELALAETVLTDPARRAAYDQSLKAAAAAAIPVSAKVVAPRPASAPPRPAERESVRKPKRASPQHGGNEAFLWVGGAIAVLAIVAATFVLTRSNSSGAITPLAATPNQPAALREPTASPARSLIVRYRPTPNDADAQVARGTARLERRPPDFALTLDGAALAAGVEVTFAKKGFSSKTVRVRPEDADRASIDVTLDPERRRLASLAVVPKWAVVAVAQGEATRANDQGLWSILPPNGADRATATVSAAGYASRTVEVSFEGTATATLLGSRRDALAHCASLGDDVALRIVARLGTFGSGVGRLAFSQNGRFLAIVEGGVAGRVHVWNVAAAKPVGPVMNGPSATKRIAAAARAVAVSNDGRLVAVSFGTLAVFDAAAGTEIFRHAETQARGMPEALAVAFTSDDASLFTLLQDGRLVRRDCETWKAKETPRGPPLPKAVNVRLSPDGNYATGDDPSGPFLWDRSRKKSLPLDLRPAMSADRPWCGRPGDELYAIASAPWTWDYRRSRKDDMEPPPRRDGLELRRFDAPSRSVHHAAEPLVVHAVEVLTPELVAAVVQRDRAFGDGLNRRGDGDFGLRVWDVPNARPIGEAFLPSRIHRMISSEDGAFLATVAERELAVYVWKVNPKGRADRRYAEPLEWEPFPPRRWEGGDPEATESDSKERVTLTEDGGGRWTLTVNGAATALHERQWTPWSVALTAGAAGDSEYLFFNNGACWTPYRGDRWPSGFDGHPGLDGNGDRDGRGWKKLYRGAWLGDDLPLRAAK